MLTNTEVLEESLRFSSTYSHPIYLSVSWALAIDTWYLLDSCVITESNVRIAIVENSDIFSPSLKHGGTCSWVLSAPGFTLLTALATLCHY